MSDNALGLTYSPPLTLLIPKLLPTTPVHLQLRPAALIQVAVAIVPTSRHRVVALKAEKMDSANDGDIKNRSKTSII